MTGKDIHLQLQELREIDVKEQQVRRQHITKTKVTQAPRNEKENQSPVHFMLYVMYITLCYMFIRELKQRQR